MTEPAEKRDAAAELELESLAEFIAQVGPGAEGVKLYRREADGKYAYLTTLPLEGFSEESVKELLGGGKYQARLVDASSKWVQGGSRVFRIAGRPKPLPEDEPPPAAPVAEPVNLELLRMMTDRDRGGGGNAMELAVGMTTAMMAAITPLIAALADRPRGEGGGAPMSEWLDVFIKAHELGRESNPGEGGYESVVRSLGVPVLNLLGQSVQQDRARTLAAAAPAGAQVAAAPPEGGPEAAPWVAAIRPWVPMLLKMAGEGRDPELYAALVLDHAGEHLLPLLDAQGADHTAKALLIHFPELVPVEPWIRRLVIAADVLTLEDGGGGQEGPEDETAQADDATAPGE